MVRDPQKMSGDQTYPPPCLCGDTLASHSEGRCAVPGCGCTEYRPDPEVRCPTCGHRLSRFEAARLEQS